MLYIHLKRCIYSLDIYKGVRVGGLCPPPPPFPLPQGFWDDSGGNGDIDVPSAKECDVVVGGGVVFFVNIFFRFQGLRTKIKTKQKHASFTRCLCVRRVPD